MLSLALAACVHRGPRRVDWTNLDTAATNRLASRTNQGTLPIAHTDAGGGWEASYQLVADEGRCYDVALAWNFDRQVSVTLHFGADGQPRVVDRIRHITRPLIGPREGGVSFCVDHGGPVRLVMRPARDTGAMLDSMDRVPRYAVAIGYRAESAQERDQRHTAEDQEAGTQHQEFVADSKEREQEHAQSRVNASCRHCRTEHARCVSRGFLSCDREYTQCVSRANTTAAACAEVP